MNDGFDLSMIDMSQTVPDNTASLISAGGMVILSVFLVLLLVIFIRYKAKIMPLIAGVLGYVIFIFMGSNFVISILPDFARPDGMTGGMEICMTSLVMTLFYTIARICVANIIKDRYKGPGDVFIAGLGLGVGDGAVYGITTIMTMSVLASSINHAGLEELLLNTGLSADAAVDLYVSTISPLIHVPPVVWLLMGISLSMDMIMNIGLMMICSGVADGKLDGRWYAITAVINFVMLIPFTFNSTNYTTTAQAVVPFVIKAAMFAAFAYMVLRIDKEKLGSMLSKDLKGYTYERMPRFGNLRKK